MKILNRSAPVHEYLIEHTGLQYKYREWVEQDSGRVLKSSVTDTRDRDVGNEEELLDLFHSLVSNSVTSYE